jgi:hypothetical protein
MTSLLLPQSHSSRAIYRVCALLALLSFAAITFNSLRTLPHYQNLHQYAWPDGQTVFTENALRDLFFLYLKRLKSIVYSGSLATVAWVFAVYAPYETAMSTPTPRILRALTLAGILTTIGAVQATALNLLSFFATWSYLHNSPNPSVAASLQETWPPLVNLLGLGTIWGLTILTWTVRNDYRRHATSSSTP